MLGYGHKWRRLWVLLMLASTLFACSERNSVGLVTHASQVPSHKHWYVEKDPPDTTTSLAVESRSFTTSAASRSRASSAPRGTGTPTVKTSTTAVVIQGDTFDALAACESTGDRDGVAPHRINPAAYNPAGPFYGAFQFAIRTWQSVGGTGDPRNSPYSLQKELAQRLRARSGWGQWPDCSRRLGLR